MATCRYCNKSGWLLRLSANGLCNACDPRIVKDIFFHANRVIECLRLIKDSNQSERLRPRYERLLEHARVLQRYEMRGIATCEPLPSDLISKFSLLLEDIKHEVEPRDLRPSTAIPLSVVPGEHHNTRLEQIIVRAEQLSSKGKARFRHSDGQVGFVEEIALHHLRKEGWEGVWAENDYWWILMALLFWDVLFAKIEGVWDSRLGEFPSTIQDHPRDLFTKEFYARRAILIRDRASYLSVANLQDEVSISLGTHYGTPCRPIENWNKYSLPTLQEGVTQLAPNILIPILDHLLQDFMKNRSGLPDLFIWKDGVGAFAEVKGPGDSLSEQQKAWASFLISLGLNVSLVHIVVSRSKSEWGYISLARGRILCKRIDKERIALIEPKGGWMYLFMDEIEWVDFPGEDIIAAACIGESPDVFDDMKNFLSFPRTRNEIKGRYSNITLLNLQQLGIVQEMRDEKDKIRFLWSGLDGEKIKNAISKMGERPTRKINNPGW